MSIVFILAPLSMVLGLLGLAGYFWSLRNGQYDDPRGAAERILQDSDRPG